MSAQNLQTRGPAALRGLLWIAVWGFSGFFLSYATLVPISVERGLSSVTGGALLLAMMVSVIGVQPLAPGLQRRVGPRRAIGGALVLMAAGHGAAILIPGDVPALLVSGVAVGTGFGILVVLATAAVPVVTPPGRTGRALGQFGATTAAAAAVGAPVGLWFSGQVTLETFRLVAGLAVAMGLLAIRRVPRRSGAQRSVERPEASRQDTGTSPSPVAAGERSWSALGVVLLPFVVSMCAYGLVIAFGPGGDGANAAVYIATMQGTAVVGRWVAGALTDRGRPGAVYTAGIALTVAGLATVALAAPGWALVGFLVVMGVGVGTVQSASLVLAFARARTPGQASVGWNMTFDTGLGVAGLLGGLGFTYLGAGPTFAGVAGALLLAGLPLWLRRR